jgi:transcriptional regulator with XRE-family HTH domain
MEMETFTNPSTSFKEGQDRAQSSLRIKYAAETQLIINKWGRLEDIRKTLGLSQRKICQLLLVDPSAWSRWTKNPQHDEAPPHIFRALSWYLLLLDKSPELSPYVFLQTVARPGLPETEIRKLTERITDDVREGFQAELSLLKRQNTIQRALLGAFVFACVAYAVILRIF